ncbi:ANTAR domain-containing protein [Lentzea sp. NPDC051208]|uniref:ANTAR domain-containing protein n=1 Tax=Lentzea sp. NPDC051208 TaxID=3154642 RepID=UPI003429F436
MLATVADGDRLLGSLNVYSHRACLRPVRRERHAAVHHWRLRRDHQRPVVAGHPHAGDPPGNRRVLPVEIDQAKGMLMAVHGCSAGEAFVMPAQRSQSRCDSAHCYRDPRCWQPPALPHSTFRAERTGHQALHESLTSGSQAPEPSR